MIMHWLAFNKGGGEVRRIYSIENISITDGILFFRRSYGGYHLIHSQM